MQIMLEDTVTKTQVAQITELLNMSALHDSDYNGVNFELVFGDFTGVVDDDSDLGQKALYAIHDILLGRREPGYTIDGAIYDRS